MKLIILPSASEDLDNGYTFYEQQEEGLGNYFFRALFSDIDALRLYAGTHPRVFGYYRRLSKKFPYAIYYSKDAETVRVSAVLDCRRDPAWIRNRLK